MAPEISALILGALYGKSLYGDYKIEAEGNLTTERRPCFHRGRDSSDVATSQGMLATTRGREKR